MKEVVVMIKGVWNGVIYTYPNMVVSEYRLEIKELIAYKLNGRAFYRCEYYNGEVEEIPEEYFCDGSFITAMRKSGRYHEYKSHNGSYDVYTNYEYDYELEKALDGEEKEKYRTAHYPN